MDRRDYEMTRACRCPSGECDPICYAPSYRAEIERLRETLEKMGEPEPGKPTNWRYTRQECADIARAALEQAPVR